MRTLTGLWFDVEKRYNTTKRGEWSEWFELWFDVEKRYNTTAQQFLTNLYQLWFDVEKRYNTTSGDVHEQRD